MCQFNVKTLSAALLGVLSVALTAGAIAYNTNWYTDTESALADGGVGNGGSKGTLSWSATLYNLCLTSGSIAGTGSGAPNGAMTFTPTCWALTSSNVNVPATDPSIAYLTGTLIPEFQSGVNALATGSMHNIAALAVAIALGVIYLISALFIYSAPKSIEKNSYCCMFLFKFLGFAWHVASILGFVIWAGGLKKAEEDFSSNFGDNANATMWLAATNSASATGFALAVGASFVGLVSCCCGCFTWQSEVVAKARGLDPYALGGYPQLPATASWGGSTAAWGAAAAQNGAPLSYGQPQAQAVAPKASSV